MSNFLKDYKTKSLPYVCVDLSAINTGDPQRLEGFIDRCARMGVEAVSVPLYRTEYLVSLVHRSELASEFRRRQLDREDVLQLETSAREQGLVLSATVYDPELLQWYEENLDTVFFTVHGGDVTFRRLLERAAELDVLPILSTAGASPDEIERALEWLDGSEAGLLHEPVDSLEEKLNPERVRWLGNTFDRPAGLRNAVGSPGLLAEVLTPSTAFWMPRIRDADTDGPGYTVAELSRLLEALTDDPERIEESSAEPADGDPSDPSGDVREYHSNYRRSLMASRSLSAGKTLEDGMIREMRPGGGLPAENLRECLGMMIPRPVDPQEMITY